METQQLSPAQLEARRSNARKSTGPRSARGKHHSRRNARKHGLYSDVEFFYMEAAQELGEDPQRFQRLFQGLIEARHPADALEQVLVEEIAVLFWKQARLERSESAVQVCNVRKHDLERRKQFIQVGRDVTTRSQNEALEKGLRVAPDAPGNFQRVISMLGILEEMAERGEFNQETFRLLNALYGEQPTLRGAGLFNIYLKLDKLPPGSQEFAEAQKLFLVALRDESLDVLEEYELFLHEHVENTRAARIAAMAPSHAQWAAIIRQQNALHRQLERKIRLLDEIQERRTQRKFSALDLMAKVSKLAPLRRRPDEPDAGGEPPPTVPSPASPEEESCFDPEPATSSLSSSQEGSCLGPASGIAGLGAPSGATESSPGRQPWVTGPTPRLRRPSPAPAGEGTGVRAASPTHGSRRGLRAAAPGGARGNAEGASKYKNRGNEAKKSLKTNEDAKTKCPKRTQNNAPHAPNEAKKTPLCCRRYRPTPRCRDWRIRPRFWRILAPPYRNSGGRARLQNRRLGPGKVGAFRP